MRQRHQLLWLFHRQWHCHQCRWALNCYGYCSSGSGYGILSDITNDSYGYGISGTGIYAFYVATGSYGYSYSGTGVNAFIASFCHGATSIGTPLTTSHNVYSY